MTTCERCGAEKPKGNRYCKDCRKAVMAEMKAAGYLSPVPTGRVFRGSEAREDVFATRNG